MRRLAPVRLGGAYDALRRFYAADGAASRFRVFIDAACVEPLDWRSAWAAVPGSWRGVNDLDREWWPLKYGAQGFLPHMLERSPFVTRDWQRANASLVVMLVLHLSGSVALTQPRCLARLMIAARLESQRRPSALFRAN